MTMRQFRVKAKRACDHCRSRKSACHIEGAPPCRLCALSGRECTFNDTGRPRKRPRTPSSSNNNNSPDGSEGASFAGLSFARQHNDAQPNVRYPVPVLPPTSSPNHAGESRTQNNLNNPITHPPHQQHFPNESQRTSHPSWLDPAVLHESFDLYANALDPVQAPWMDSTLLDMTNDDFNIMRSPADQLDLNQSRDPVHRLDNTYSLSLGLTGDPDPYITRNYQHGSNNLFVFKRLAIRSLSQDQLPVQFLVSPTNIVSSSASQEKSVSEGPSLHAQLAQIIGPDVGSRYIELYGPPRHHRHN